VLELLQVALGQAKGGFQVEREWEVMDALDMVG